MAKYEPKTLKIAGTQFDITFDNGGAGTVWIGSEKVARKLPCVEIEYRYRDGTTNRHHTIREGRSAVEFIVTAWIYHREILNVTLHTHNS